MNIQLKSKEGEIFNVPKKVIKCATNIMYAMNIYQVKGPFPLPRTGSMALHKIITWATYHKDDPEPVENSNNDEDDEYNESDIDSWDIKLLNVDSAMLSEIKLGANCLGIKALEATCEVLTKNVKKRKFTSEK